jgi:hypothetical protein
MYIKLFFVLLLFFITSCSTGYQSQGLAGGYSEQLTGQNTATVFYKSNAFSSMSETRKHAMRRAAELTLQKGYDYFLIESDNQYVKNQKFSGTVQCNTYGYSTTCNNVGGGTFRKPRVQLNIRMFNGTVPNETGYYDARYLAQ